MNEQPEACPVCGAADVEHQPLEPSTIRYCRACKFQWSTELSLYVLASLAASHKVWPVTEEGPG